MGYKLRTMFTIENRTSTIMGARRLKISDLADGAGIAYNTARAYYHGERSQLDLQVLARICEFLQCDIGDILVLVTDGESAP